MTDDLAPNPAYEAALRSGRFTENQWLIWAALFRHRTLSTRSIGVLLSPDPDPTLPARLAEMERLGLIQGDRVHQITYWSALALDQLPVAPVPPPPGRQELIQRFQDKIIHELEDGVAAADPAAFVARWTSAVREVGAR